MNIVKRRNLIGIIVNFVFIIMIIILINIIPKKINSNLILPDTSTAIIGGADGPTTIYVSSNYSVTNLVINSVLFIFIINLTVLLIFYIFGFIKSKTFIKIYKLKIILSIDVYLLIIFVLYYCIPFFGIGFIGISVLLNFLLLTLIFVKDFIIRIVKQEN